MKKTKKYRSPLMASIHKTAEGLNAAGLTKKPTMRKFDEMCLEADNFLDQDLSDYIRAENFAPFHFEYGPKQKSIRLPRSGKRRTRRRSGK